MPWGLKRYQNTGDLHFITFSCYHRQPFLSTSRARRLFEETLEQVRCWYAVDIKGYVVMPEHVHLLLSEPERSSLPVVIQMLKQITAQKIGTKVSDATGQRRLWQVRYYDFNVRTREKQIEKLRYLHRNPVKRGLVEKPEDWEWSSFRHYATGVEGVVEIESEWTGRKRERMGMALRLKIVAPVSFGDPGPVTALGPPSPQKTGRRVGHPRFRMRV